MALSAVENNFNSFLNVSPKKATRRVLLDTTPRALLRGVDPRSVAVYRIQHVPGVTQRGWVYKRQYPPNLRAAPCPPPRPLSACGRLRPKSAPLLREMDTVALKASRSNEDGTIFDISQADSIGFEILAAVGRARENDILRRMIRFRSQCFGAVDSLTHEVMRTIFHMDAYISRPLFVERMLEQCPTIFENNPRIAAQVYDAITLHPSESVTRTKDFLLVLYHVEGNLSLLQTFARFLEEKKYDRPYVSKKHLHAIICMATRKDDKDQARELLNTVSWGYKERMEWYSFAMHMKETHPDLWKSWLPD